MSIPQKIYVQPEDYNCDLIISTSWDGCHPVQHFEKELVVNHTHTDYMGMDYRLMSTEDPKIFILQVSIPSP